MVATTTTTTTVVYDSLQEYQVVWIKFSVDKESFF